MKRSEAILERINDLIICLKRKYGVKEEGK
jgi:hypothetical protein